jgi:hypothetical protein
MSSPQSHLAFIYLIATTNNNFFLFSSLYTTARKCYFNMADEYVWVLSVDHYDMDNVIGIFKTAEDGLKFVGSKGLKPMKKSKRDDITLLPQSMRKEK